MLIDWFSGQPLRLFAICIAAFASAEAIASWFLMSLKLLVETGQGNPAPNDVKIDHWN